MFVAEGALGTDYQRRFRVNCTALDSGMGGIQCSSYNIEVRAMDVACVYGGTVTTTSFEALCALLPAFVVPA